MEEKVPVVLVPEKKEGPAPKGRDIHCSVSLNSVKGHLPDAGVCLSVCLLPASRTVVCLIVS